MNGYRQEGNRRFPSESQRQKSSQIDFFSGDFVDNFNPKQEYRSGRSSVPAHLLSRTENNFSNGFTTKKPIPPERTQFFDFDSNSWIPNSNSTLPWRKNQNRNHQQPPDVREQFRSIADQSNRLIDDLLAPYSLTLPVPSRQNQLNPNLETNFSRRPNSVITEPILYQNQRRIDPLRLQNKEKIQSSLIHFRNPFVAPSTESEINPRPTHRTFSEPNGYQTPHTLDILSTSLYDPNSPYYSNRQSTDSEVTQKPYFSDTDEFFFDDDDEMNRTTPNWRSNFSQVRDRFGTKAQNSDDGSLPYAHDFSFASDGSLTMPRNRGLLKSTSQTAIGNGRLENSKSLSMLQNSLNRRAETPEIMFRRNSETPENNFRRSSETPEARRALGNFWLETVRNRASSPSIQVQRPIFKMTAAQERLEQLHEPVDSPTTNDGFQTLNLNSGFNNGIGKINGNGNFRRIGSESVAQRKMQFIAEDKNGGISSTTKPFLSERFISERKAVNGNNNSNGNGSYSFASLDNAVADLRQNTEKLIDSKGCAKFPIGEFSSNLPVKRIGIFTGTRISPPRSFSTNQQHSPSPDSLSGESTASLANLPHPRPKHNIREQLMNAGVGNNTYLGPYMGRRPGTPNFPAPSSGSVASRISVFEKRPGTPTLLQLAVGSSPPQIPEPPRSPLSPRTTVFRTKSVIHVDMGPESEKRIGAVSPEYDNRRIGIISTSAAFTFKDQHDPNFSPRWRSDTINEAQPMLKSIHQKETANSQITLTPIKKPVEPLTTAKFHFELEQPPTKSPYSTTSNHEPIVKSLHKTHEIRTLQNGLPPMIPNYSKIAGKLANTERFHFPAGKPVSKAENDAVLQRVQQLFNAQPNIPASGFDEIAKRIGLPLYSKKAIFEACCQCSLHPVNLTPTVNFQDFVGYWNKMTLQSHDESSRFIFTLSVAKSGLPGKNYLQREDFQSIFFDLIFTYPGLKFLIDASQFHARYVEVVTARIFWNVNRSWSGKITSFELKKSNFLQTMKILEQTDEINKVTDYFSYEHFYVIYCKFWELDTDHDMVISRDDMKLHGGGALTDRIIDRIFSPAVTRVPKKINQSSGPIKSGPLETIGFEEFVAFLLAEEDKRHPTAIEYWFRCLDLDGDGVISMYEMELFYKDIAAKINQKGYETLSFKDVASQLYDLVSPVDKQIRLADLKRCGLAYRFFNTFVNYIKYLEQESSDGERASVKMNGDKEMSDWEQFCAVEYEILMTEADQGDEGNDESYDLVVDDDGELDDGAYQDN